MASPTPSKRSEQDPSDVSGAAALPTDGLYEILLRLPAKDLCRLRAVCRSWRSLASDPLFIKDHAARHTRPFLATSFVDPGEDVHCGVSIVDLCSGDVIKQIRTRDKDLRLQRTYLDRVCMVGGRHPLAVTALNPATGATVAPSADVSEEYADLLERRFVSMESCAFGKVPSTGEYKALRFLHVGSPVGSQHLCEVMTLDAGSNHVRWRPKPGPPLPVCSNNKITSVVIDGVVYFLFGFVDPCYRYLKTLFKPGTITPFNLETEEWMPTISGPESVTSYYMGANKITTSRSPEAVEHISITNLNGSLVIVHLVHRVSMDLWFLMDVERGLWVKKYSIRYRSHYRRAYPLVLLDDETIIFIMQSKDTLISYDTKTDTFTDMFNLQDYRSIAIYTGSLLS
ncbi:uncharacterized protein [Lolium perenne]|uniref:uncharacterized protein n=1 Tax=Lolium perenne TaxID=4522 RepID=UPI0021EA8959|nr:uncharacterized protein LOC127322052 [Lolium perenne]XP_051206961.1 uncharacterized protein LOC127322052 [Lolium perenne]XP_051206962.1 uncharacterized protein LOC127322052 [Lolium perenne]